jgi:SAM-dependent methyltransferase
VANDATATDAYREDGRGRALDRIREVFNPNIGRLATEADTSMIRRHLNGGTLLDVGCGTGRVAIPMARTGGNRLVGLDASYSMLNQLGRSADAQAACVERVNAVAQGQLPFDDSVFDGAYCFGVLTKYENWQAVLGPLVPCIKDGGHILFDQGCMGDGGVSSTLSPARIGGIRLGALAGALADIGLTCVGVFPHHFASGVGVVARWFEIDDDAVTQRELSLATRRTKHYLEGLLAQPGCYAAVTDFETGLRHILAGYPLAPYAFVVARRTSIPPSKDAEQPIQWKTPAGSALFAEVEELLLERLARSTKSNGAFVKYLCILDPFLREVCGGDSPVETAYPALYARHFAEVRRNMERIVRSRWRNELDLRLSRILQRSYRRWLLVTDRFSRE